MEIRQSHLIVPENYDGHNEIINKMLCEMFVI
jgi:hypothetical protein